MKTKLIITMALLMTVVGKAAATDYNFWVAEVFVTSANASNIAAASNYITLGSGGYVYYTASDQTLHVKNATINRTGSGQRCIENTGNQYMSVVFEGENTLYSESSSPVLCSTSTYLKCDNGGHAYIHCKTNDALTANGCTVYIRNANLTIKSDQARGLESDTNNNAFEIKNSTLTIEGAEGAASRLQDLKIFGISNVTFVGNNNKVTVNSVKNFVLDEVDMEFSQPSGAYFDPDKQAICTSSYPSGYKGTIKCTTTAIPITATYFPDPNFREYVSSNCDLDHNGYLGKSERNRTDLAPSGKQISNLKGIEHFTELTYLDCSANTISSLDLSKNTKLQDLRCFYNNLTSLNMSGCSALQKLYCRDNSLTSLNVSGCSALQILYCNNNSLTSLNVSGHSALQELYCYNNSLTTLNVSGCSALRTLHCYDNRIKGANMVSLINGMPTVTSGTIRVYDSSSTEQNRCTIKQVNMLTGKGWTVRSSSGSIYIGNNDIEVDDSYFPDPNFREWVSQNCDTDTHDGYLYPEEQDAVKEINVNSKSISNLKGIEHFTKLTWLNCSRNNLTSLDVTKNTALSAFDCSSNQLTSLDVTKNTALNTLDCSWNKLTELDVTKNTALLEFNCSGNQLGSLNVTKNTALSKLYCYYNQLSSLDVTKNTALSNLYCYNNQLSSLDVTKNTALNTLDCSWNKLTELDVSKNTALLEFDCSRNQLSSLDASKNTALITLLCNQNSLGSLNLSGNPELQELQCYDNQLTALDLTKNTKLRFLQCNFNRIKDAAMTTLVTSLPRVSSGEFRVYTIEINENSSEQNECSTNNVARAQSKGWTVYYENEGLGDWFEYPHYIPTDIHAATADAIDNDASRFNMQGQRVGSDYKGIVIVNGKKVRVK